MHTQISRRGFLGAAPATSIGALAAGGLFAASARATPEYAAASPAPPTLPHFPAHDPQLVREVVGLSHRSLEGVQRMVDRQPTLARATWDWGFGDFETAIGAASHTGQREIAVYLMSKGARPDIFTFAMLGALDAVRAMIDASPGAQRIPGPHGISLLRHAEAGGDAAKPVLDYLRSLGDADARPSAKTLTDAEKEMYTGVYSFGPGPADRLEIKPGRMAPLTISRIGANAINLFLRDDGGFHPPGCPSVRIAFTLDAGRATRIECFDPELMLTANRV